MIACPPFDLSPIPFAIVPSGEWAFRAEVMVAYSLSDILFYDTPGIYMIYNTVTERAYVGASRNIPRRWRLHARQMLTKYKHHPAREMIEDYHQRGAGSFRYVILEVCTDHAAMNERESFWYHQVHSDPQTDSGYNGPIHRPYGKQHAPGK